jgi:hypothetical protein
MYALITRKKNVRIAAVVSNEGLRMFKTSTDGQVTEG